MRSAGRGRRVLQKAVDLLGKITHGRHAGRADRHQALLGIQSGLELRGDDSVADGCQGWDLLGAGVKDFLNRCQLGEAEASGPCSCTDG